MLPSSPMRCSGIGQLTGFYLSGGRITEVQSCPLNKTTTILYRPGATPPTLPLSNPDRPFSRPHSARLAALVLSQHGRRLPSLPILPRPPPKFSESRRRSVDDRLPRHPWHLPPVGLRPAASMERLIDRPGADVGPCPFTLPGQSQNIPAGGRWNLPGSKFFEPAGPSWRTSCYM